MIAKRRRTQLVAARKAAGYTQEGLAEALHVDRTTVIRWESGARTPLPYLRPKLARLLKLSHEQLQSYLVNDTEPGAPAVVSSVPVADQAVPLDDMKRRTLMKWGVATTAAASLSVSAGTSVGMADVKRLERAAARLHNLDQQHGGDTLWQAALAQADDGMQLLEYGRYTDAVGHQLLVATGQLHICAGWLAFDAGQHEVAQRCFTDALAMSRQANHPQIETRALANLALQSNALSRPREAMRYALGAEHAARAKGAPLWLAAIPQLRLAMGSSLTGSKRDTDRAITRARQVLDRSSDTTDQEWSAFLSPLEIDAVEATCATQLQQPARAERLLDQAIHGYLKQCARNVALYRVRLARARLEAGTVDGAAEAAHDALDDLSGEVASWRVSSELDAVASRLKAHPHVDGVEEFMARYEAAS